jgi:arylsulfatase A-like enzyme
MMPTLAALTGQKLAAGAGPDAVNVLPALLGEKDARGRDELVLQNNGQAPLALRSGPWKLVQRAQAEPELFNLASDPSEKNDLAAKEPARVKDMVARLATLRGEGVSTDAKVRKKKKQ